MMYAILFSDGRYFETTGTVCDSVNHATLFRELDLHLEAMAAGVCRDFNEGLGTGDKPLGYQIVPVTFDQAFPGVNTAADQQLLDEFAKAALPGVITLGLTMPEEIAGVAYQRAGEMLQERKRLRGEA